MSNIFNYFKKTKELWKNVKDNHQFGLAWRSYKKITFLTEL